MILDNHAYSIYLSRNLSFYLYYTRSPSPDFRRELPPQGAERAFLLTQTHLQIPIYRYDSASKPRRCATLRFDVTRR